MIVTYGDQSPRLGRHAFVADTATVLGSVSLGKEASIWYGAVLRGDVGTIHIGDRTNIQDLTVVHVTTDTFDTFIGDDVTVGHRAILHGCRVGNRTLIGMGAIVMDGVSVGEGCIVAAGCLLTPGTQIPANSMVMGSPGKVVRKLKDSEHTHLMESAAHYVALAKTHTNLA